MRADYPPLSQHGARRFRAMAATSYDRIADLVGLTEAARHLGVSSKTVRELVHHGRLPARRLGPLWYVERRVLEEFAETYQPRRLKRSPRSQPPPIAALEAMARDISRRFDPPPPRLRGRLSEDR